MEKRILLAGGELDEENAAGISFKPGTLNPRGEKMRVKYVASIHFAEEKAREKGYSGIGAVGQFFPSEVDDGDTFTAEEKEVELVGKISHGLVGFHDIFHYGTDDDWHAYYVWVPGNEEKDYGYYKCFKLGDPYESQYEFYRLVSEIYVMLDGVLSVRDLANLAKFAERRIELAVESATIPLKEKIKTLENELAALKVDILKSFFTRLTSNEAALLRKAVPTTYISPGQLDEIIKILE